MPHREKIIHYSLSKYSSSLERSMVIEIFKEFVFIISSFEILNYYNLNFTSVNFKA